MFVYPLLNLLATYHQQKQHTVAPHRYIKKQTHGGYWQLIISLKNALRKINKYKQYQKLLLKFLFVQICWAGNLQIFHDRLISKFQRSTCKIGHTQMLFFSSFKKMSFLNFHMEHHEFFPSVSKKHDLFSCTLLCISICM